MFHENIDERTRFIKEGEKHEIKYIIKIFPSDAENSKS